MVIVMYPRHLRPLTLEAVDHARILFVAGARQVGKTTLIGDITAPDGQYPMTAHTLDDRPTREAAISDPAGFVAGLGGSALSTRSTALPTCYWN